MQIKWIVFLAGLWVGIAFICGLCEGAYFADPTYGDRTGDKPSKGQENSSVLTDLYCTEIFTSSSLFDKISGIADPKMWGALTRIISLDFKIFAGDWQLVRYCLLMPISVGVTYTLAYSGARLIRGGG